VKLGTTPRNGGKEQGRGTQRKSTDSQIQQETCLEATKHITKVCFISKLPEP